MKRDMFQFVLPECGGADCGQRGNQSCKRTWCSGCCRKATTVDGTVCHQHKIVDKKEQADFRAKKARSKENKKSADVARSKPTKKRAKKE